MSCVWRTTFSKLSLQATQSTGAPVQEDHQLQPDAPRVCTSGPPCKVKALSTFYISDSGHPFYILHYKVVWLRPPSLNLWFWCALSSEELTLLIFIRRNAGNHSTSPVAAAQDKTLTESEPKSASSMLSRWNMLPLLRRSCHQSQSFENEPK